MNSWRMTLAEVPTAEMLEVQLVNAVAPFILCGKLKPLMLRERRRPSHIVNVSAMEGQFSRAHQDRQAPAHEHGEGRAQHDDAHLRARLRADGIYMNAVDTGWVTDEDPAAHAGAQAGGARLPAAARHRRRRGARLDPFFSGIHTGEHVWGKFFKDYRPTKW